jgi:hypothetical protein
MDHRPKRNRWQFGTRTLLVAVLLIAIGLTVWRTHVAPFARQRQGIEVLQELGVSVATTAADGPAWQRWLVGEDDFVEVSYVDLSDDGQWLLFKKRARIDDRVIGALAQLHSVRTLNLKWTEITDQQLRLISVIPTLSVFT